MDLDRMLEKCHTQQWSVGDLDWSRRPRDLSRDDERAIVQYFTDMAGIERLAGALFEHQRRHAETDTLREIFRTCVVDEVRHAHAAQMLADFYDVHKLGNYQLSPSLQAFRPHFVEAVKHLSPGIANTYITGGELILDVALLRSINDYVDDDMSHEAMRLINRDESRHIAMDYFMTEYYCSRPYLQRQKMSPRRTYAQHVKASIAFSGVLLTARPFFEDVFFTPMSRVDPGGRRLKEAFKRLQLLGEKDEVAKMPFARFMRTLQDAFNHPVTGRLFGPVLLRLMGTNPELAVQLYSDEEAQRTKRMSFDELASEALSAKALH